MFQNYKAQKQIGGKKNKTKSLKSRERGELKLKR